MRFATIDVGTNTAQLLVVEHTGDGLRRMHDVERFVRLGEGVDARGRIGEAAQKRLLSVLREHVATAADYDAEVAVVGATSAMRDAANREDVCRAVREEVGLAVDVLTGEEEATWSFAAACAPFDDLQGEVLVVDVGGGSTELVAGRDPAGQYPDVAAAITGHASLDVGCIRLTERCFDAQPPSAAAVRAADAAITDALASAALDVRPGAVLVGTAGTATALALVDAGPDSSEALLREAGPTGAGTTLSAADVRGWRERLLQLSVDEIRALHPAAMEGRADVFPVGVMLLDRILRHFRLDACRVSPYELRYGLALRELSTGEGMG
jgi:exopolyphosphatase/guanosine-5'-triphosphate,3'-diphosphate pyrophosphatase